MSLLYHEPGAEEHSFSSIIPKGAVDIHDLSLDEI